MDTIAALQALAHPLWTAILGTLSALGNEEVLIVAMPLVCWSLHKHMGLRLIVFFALSIYVNSAAKHNFAVERPPAHLHMVAVDGYAFPSGHAQGNAVFWGYVALWLRRPWAYGVAIAMTLLVALSRVYLGVHYPMDVVFGMGLGLVLLVLYAFLVPRLGDPRRAGTGAWFLVSLAAVALLLMVHSSWHGIMMAGFILGALWGYRLESDWLGYVVQGAWWQHVGRAVVGVGGLFAMRAGAKALVVDVLGVGAGSTGEELALLARYWLLGLWVTMVAPWLFVVTGLAWRERTAGGFLEFPEAEPGEGHVGVS